MPSRGEEKTIGEWRGVGEPGGQRVRLEVIDCNQRSLADHRNGLCRRQAHDQAANQARPRGDGDPVQGGKRQARIRHGPGDDHVEGLDVGARGDLRHHAAERRMLVDLREHDVGEDSAAPRRRPAVGGRHIGPFHHRGPGFIAGRLDAEHNHSSLYPATVRMEQSAIRGR